MRRSFETGHPYMSDRDRSERVLAVLRAATEPLTAKQISERMGESEWQADEKQRRVLNVMVAAAHVERSDGRPAKFSLVASTVPATLQTDDDCVAAGRAAPAVAIEKSVDPDLYDAVRVAQAESTEHIVAQLVGTSSDTDATPPVGHAGGPDTVDRLLSFVSSAPGPHSVVQIGRAIGSEHFPRVGELCVILQHDGYLTRVSEKPPLYAAGERLRSSMQSPTTETERYAVEVPEHGHAGVTDPDVLDEIEAEKVWMTAAHLRAANATWGVDCGLDADVREARALMAEARRQVRDRAPLGEHYRVGEPS